MTITFDTHTHTTRSGHAYSTLEENIAACVRYGLEGFATTDHGPALEGASPLIHFMNMQVIPRVVDGIHVLRGVEANIIDFKGNLDIPDPVMKKLDVCIASFHELCLQAGSREEHTAAWLTVINNPYIDIIGHSGRGDFSYDLDAILPACKAHGKLVEINNNTLKSGKNAESCRQIAAACIRYQVPVVVNSDAHFSRQVGQVDQAMALLQKVNFPLELIVNRSYAEFSGWLKARKPWLKDL